MMSVIPHLHRRWREAVSDAVSYVSICPCASACCQALSSCIMPCCCACSLCQGILLSFSRTLTSASRTLTSASQLSSLPFFLSPRVMARAADWHTFFLELIFCVSCFHISLASFATALAMLARLRLARGSNAITHSSNWSKFCPPVSGGFRDSH